MSIAPLIGLLLEYGILLTVSSTSLADIYIKLYILVLIYLSFYPSLPFIVTLPPEVAFMVTSAYLSIVFNL
jgi:hypothetical protein